MRRHVYLFMLFANAVSVASPKEKYFSDFFVKKFFKWDKYFLKVLKIIFTGLNKALCWQHSTIGVWLSSNSKGKSNICSIAQFYIFFFSFYAKVPIHNFHTFGMKMFLKDLNFCFLYDHWVVINFLYLFCVCF